MRIGYILKGFPKLSETFIAREIHELERIGFDVTVIPLRPTVGRVPHRWITSLRAEVLDCQPDLSFSSAWNRLKAKAQQRPDLKEGIGTAVAEAFDCPLRSGRRYLAEAAAIAEIAERRQLQHLHAHFANHPAFVAMLVHLISGIPYSFTAHAKDIYVAPPTPELWRSLIEHAAFGVTVSDANRAHIESIVGRQLGRKVMRLYNGVDLDQFRPVVGARNGRPRILFVGRLIEKKGADVLLEAASILRQRGHELDWTIVGSGDLEQPLRARAAELLLDQTVRFTSALSHEAVVEEMRRSSVFALPCRVAANGDRDALPTVLLEALAAGVPSVSTPVNGVPEIIEHGHTGLLVPEGDASRFAEAVETLVTEPLLHRKMSLASQRRARELFDASNNVFRLATWFARREPAQSSAGAGAGGALATLETVPQFGR